MLARADERHGENVEHRMPIPLAQEDRRRDQAPLESDVEPGAPRIDRRQPRQLFLRQFDRHICADVAVADRLRRYFCRFVIHLFPSLARSNPRRWNSRHPAYAASSSRPGWLAGIGVSPSTTTGRPQPDRPFRKFRYRKTLRSSDASTISCENTRVSFASDSPASIIGCARIGSPVSVSRYGYSTGSPAFTKPAAR